MPGSGIINAGAMLSGVTVYKRKGLRKEKRRDGDSRTVPVF